MKTLTTPDSISGAFASGANAVKNEIPNASTGSYLASMEDGFPVITMQPVSAGGTPPDGKDFNGILNKVTQFYFQFQNGYLPTFVQATSDLIGGYPEGAVLWYTPAGERKAIPLISVIENNEYNFNTNPEYIDGEHWEYAITGNYVTVNTAQTISGAKTFTGATKAPTVASVTDNSTNVATTAFVTSVLNAIWPVGSVYIGTQTTCPMATLIPNSTWQLVASDKALWTGDGTNGNTTKDAGLPNITGSFKIPSYNTGAQSVSSSGCCASSQTGGGVRSIGYAEQFYAGTNTTIDASRSSSVYKNDVTTVQPPAYVVNVWRRTV